VFTFDFLLAVFCRCTATAARFGRAALGDGESCTVVKNGT
jgi:hypothetical protein